MGILIGADLVPAATNICLFQEAKLKELFGKELQTVIAEADYRIFNLEVPSKSMARI